jgi:succinate dehydrogenase/fumarate reductase flavoprotein subunit
VSTVLVAGAGMAGLVAAARLRELDVPVEVREKGDRPGGAMILSSGVVWRHRGLEEFRHECPGGDPALQRLIVERLDELLDWLEALGARVVARETGNPRTVGRRFDPHRLTETLVRAAGAVHLSSPVTALPAGLAVLATGGFAVSLARELALPLRAGPWAEGDGIRLARERGAALGSGLDEFYGRALPAPPARISDADFVRAAQLYGHLAHVVDDAGIPFFGREPHWSETDLVQALATRPGGRGWYVLDRHGLEHSLRDRSVTEMVAVAEALGGEVRRSQSVAELGLGPLLSPKLATPPFTAVHVVASVTHTLGGLVIDEEARVLDPDGVPVPQLYACGVDAGGIATGGYASGLAAGLVLGVAAAESIVGR